MKITKQQLNRIIKEETLAALNEFADPGPRIRQLPTAAQGPAPGQSTWCNDCKSDDDCPKPEYYKTARDKGKIKTSWKCEPDGCCQQQLHSYMIYTPPGSAKKAAAKKSTSAEACDLGEARMQLTPKYIDIRLNPEYCPKASLHRRCTRSEMRRHVEAQLKKYNNEILDLVNNYFACAYRAQQNNPLDLQIRQERHELHEALHEASTYIEKRLHKVKKDHGRKNYNLAREVLFNLFKLERHHNPASRRLKAGKATLKQI